MYRFAKAAADLTGPVVRQISQVRYRSTTKETFHTKYGTAVLVSGAVFCTSVWGYIITKADVYWGLSPVKRLMPRPWKEDEEE